MGTNKTSDLQSDVIDVSGMSTADAADSKEKSPSPGQDSNNNDGKSGDTVEPTQPSSGSSGIPVTEACDEDEDMEEGGVSDTTDTDTDADEETQQAEQLKDSSLTHKQQPNGALQSPAGHGVMDSEACLDQSKSDTSSESIEQGLTEEARTPQIKTFLNKISKVVKPSPTKEQRDDKLVLDKDLSTSVGDISLPCSVEDSSVPPSVGDPPVLASVGDPPVPPSVEDPPVLTSVADPPVLTSVADPPVPTSQGDNSSAPTSVSETSAQGSAPVGLVQTVSAPAVLGTCVTEDAPPSPSSSDEAFVVWVEPATGKDIPASASQASSQGDFITDIKVEVQAPAENIQENGNEDVVHSPTGSASVTQTSHSEVTEIREAAKYPLVMLSDSNPSVTTTVTPVLSSSDSQQNHSDLHTTAPVLTSDAEQPNCSEQSAPQEPSSVIVNQPPVTSSPSVLPSGAQSCSPLGRNAAQQTPSDNQINSAPAVSAAPVLPSDGQSPDLIAAPSPGAASPPVVSATRPSSDTASSSTSSSLPKEPSVTAPDAVSAGTLPASVAAVATTDSHTPPASSSVDVLSPAHSDEPTAAAPEEDNDKSSLVDAEHISPPTRKTVDIPEASETTATDKDTTLILSDVVKKLKERLKAEETNENPREISEAEPRQSTNTGVPKACESGGAEDDDDVTPLLSRSVTPYESASPESLHSASPHADGMDMDVAYLRSSPVFSLPGSPATERSANDDGFPDAAGYESDVINVPTHPESSDSDTIQYKSGGEEGSQANTETRQNEPVAPNSPSHSVHSERDSGPSSADGEASVSSPTADSPPHEASVSSPAADSPPLEASVSSPTTDSRPHEASVSSPAADSRPHEASVSCPTANSPPHEASVSPSAADSPPHEASISSPAADSPPHEASVSSPTADSPPHEASVSSSAAGSPPHEAPVSSLAAGSPQLEACDDCPVARSKPPNSPEVIMLDSSSCETEEDLVIVLNQSHNELESSRPEALQDSPVHSPPRSIPSSDSASTYPYTTHHASDENSEPEGQERPGRERPCPSSGPPRIAATSDGELSANHGLPKPVPSPSRPQGLYKCQFCPYSTEYDHRIKRHLEAHAKQMQILNGMKCPYCAYRCSHIRLMRMHFFYYNVHPGSAPGMFMITKGVVEEDFITVTVSKHTKCINSDLLNTKYNRSLGYANSKPNKKTKKYDYKTFGARKIHRIRKVRRKRKDTDDDSSDEDYRAYNTRLSPKRRRLSPGSQSRKDIPVPRRSLRGRDPLSSSVEASQEASPVKTRANSSMELTSPGKRTQELTSLRTRKQELTSPGTRTQELASPGTRTQELTSPRTRAQELTSPGKKTQELTSPGKRTQGMVSGMILSIITLHVNTRKGFHTGIISWKIGLKPYAQPTL